MKKKLWILVITLLLSCCGCSKTVMRNNQEMVLLSLYFPHKDTLQLTEEKRFVPKEDTSSVEKTIICVLKELQKGPENQSLLCPFPKEGDMKLSRFSANLAVVDFDSTFFQAHKGDSMSEFLTLSAITNSLTKIPEVNHVSFTVDGIKSQTLKGHFELTETFLFSVDELRK